VTATGIFGGGTLFDGDQSLSVRGHSYSRCRQSTVPAGVYHLVGDSVNTTIFSTRTLGAKLEHEIDFVVGTIREKAEVGKVDEDHNYC
jgi:hypothetical protein